MIKLQKAIQKGLHGELLVPGDKSISHRALMFGAIAEGKTEIKNFLTSADVLHTMGVFKSLGVDIDYNDERVLVNGRGLGHFNQPNQALDMGNSGTSTRLLMGLLSRQPFDLAIFGDASLSKRPLNRVSEPLKQMGAKFELSQDNYLPGVIQANNTLHGITYQMPVASAQVKSAILLAGMQAEGETTVIETIKSRDHTERMLQQFGGHIQIDGNQITVTQQERLLGQQVLVPSDISSAAFFIVAALITPHSEITLKNVGVNPTRIGVLTLLERMGAIIEIHQHDTIGEPIADITVRSQDLQGINITAADIPSAVDELPILALAATQASGDTVISGAEELRVKETDRIATVVTELKKLGANIEETSDGMIIHGGTPLQTKVSATVNSHGDHRIGMMLAVAGLITAGDVTLQDELAMAVSYPEFLSDLKQVIS